MQPVSNTFIDQALVASFLKKRAPGSHKGDHGHALLLAGEKGKMGAAVIAATACLRSGIGLLTVNVPSEERQILQVAVPEAMLVMREEDRDVSSFDAIGLGPGMGTGGEASALLESILQQSQRPLLLDADALTLLSKDQGLWASIPVDSILTPHPGEFDRMFGKHASAAERKEKALQLSSSHPWVIVLKGQHTQIFYKGNMHTNTSGNAGLAKGGSGDALSGMTLAFLAQAYPALQAAIVAVYLHGLAADIALKDQSVESLIITDIFPSIGKAFRQTAM